MPASDLPVAVLAGGMAKRLQPLTKDLPKAMVDVNGQPFIRHQLRLLHAQGFKRVILCVGHLGEAIERLIGDGAGLGLQIGYSFDGPALRGTAGALRHALGQLGDAFFVVHGDAYLECDMGLVQAAFRDSGKPALMTVFHNADSWGASNVEYSEGRILAYDKRRRTPAMSYIDYGVAVFRSSVFATLAEDRPCDLETVFQELLRKDQLAALEVFQRFYEIGSPQGLDDTLRYLAEKSTMSERQP